MELYAMVWLVRALFGVLGAFWLVVGGFAVSGALDFGLPEGARILGILMLGNGAALVAAGWVSLRGHRVVDFLAVLLVLVNAVPSLTDEVGVLDVASLAVNGTLLGLLVAGLRSRPGNSEGRV
jgi:hypothetical protein